MNACCSPLSLFCQWSQTSRRWAGQFQFPQQRSCDWSMPWPRAPRHLEENESVSRALSKQIEDIRCNTEVRLTPWANGWAGSRWWAGGPRREWPEKRESEHYFHDKHTWRGKQNLSEWTIKSSWDRVLVLIRCGNVQTLPKTLYCCVECEPSMAWM